MKLKTVTIKNITRYYKPRLNCLRGRGSRALRAYERSGGQSGGKLRLLSGLLTEAHFPDA